MTSLCVTGRIFIGNGFESIPEIKEVKPENIYEEMLKLIAENERMYKMIKRDATWFKNTPD